MSLNERKQKKSESGLGRKSAQLASHEQVEHPHLSHSESPSTNRVVE